MAEEGGNRPLAAASVAAGFALFAFLRLGGGGEAATLSSLAAASVPLDVALANGRPTVLEAYADWCEVCNEMVPVVSAVEGGARAAGVNYAMINVDNDQARADLEPSRIESR